MGNNGGRPSYASTGRGGRSCLLAIIGLLAAPWLLDLLLAGSAVMA